MYQIRNGVEADSPRIVAIINDQVNEPTTVDEFMRQEQQRRPEDIFQRLVAVDGQGVVQGFGMANHGEMEQPGHFFIRVRVDKPVRRQGIGFELYARTEEFARARGAVRLDTHVNEDDPASQAWTERRGFVKQHHLFESTIDLAQFDPARFGDEVERVRERGIRIVDLATQFPGEDRMRRYYDLHWEVFKDVPVFGELRAPSFENWLKWVTGDPHFNPQSIFLAMQGDRCAGLTDMARTNTGGMYNSFTGVFREFRGQGVAMALKVVGLSWAKQQGIPYVRTNNHSANQPMLAVNRKLGYVSEPGFFIYHKDLK